MGAAGSQDKAAGDAVAPAEEEEEDDLGLQWDEAAHGPQLPADGVFTMETLRKWNGVELPMFLAICGKVVDVSSSRNFLPDHGYGKLWAGKDATYAMATVSLKAEMVAKMDFKLEELEQANFDALVGWYKHFLKKYPERGTLKEYDGWDFSKVISEAEAMEGGPAFGS
mmetsp:Transcript_41640/g.111096  ORF Transcript_41640/g.111096 Transcript_41640/m.111096 type:complete len:168 (+) Transcript_41640:99-602(+)